MRINLNVDVRHLTRVEGHGNLKVVVRNGEVEEARWDIVETPRYFEVMLKGKHYSTAPGITSRICGICSISHCLASLHAIERGFGITIPETAAKLRLLAKHGETLQSRYLHLFFLAAPDFVGQPSVLPLLDASPETVALALQLKGLANRLCDVVAGRTTHPVSLQPGGVARMPKRDQLLELRDELEGSLDTLDAMVNLFRSFSIPDFVRETEFVSLQHDAAYAFIGGRVVSSDGMSRKEDDYQQMSNEYVEAHNTSKWCRLSRDSYAVGALARFNNNHRQLLRPALDAASALRLKPVCHNPFMNNLAQLVECVHVTHDAIRLLEELVDQRDTEIMVPVQPRSGAGVGAIEAPRGVLYHHYEFDRAGRIVRANCVIPTTQNNANIHHDLRALVRQFAVQGMTDEGLERLCSMLVRAYDPCISCSVH